MKTEKRIITLTLAGLAFAFSCGNAYKIDIPKWDYDNDGKDQTETELPVMPDPSTPKVPTLNDPDGKWRTSTYNGLTLYSFDGWDETSGAYQNVNVLEVDLNNPRYGIKFAYIAGGDSTSHMVLKEPEAIAGINGGYELEAIYVKVNNSIISEVSLPSNHLRFWKHEAAIFSTGERNVGIFYAGKDGTKAIETYQALDADNIIASAPMLVNDYDPIGEEFVDASYTEEQLGQFDYEDYRNHQGVRHPRTVYALTDDNDLLLITIDGRTPGDREGMNAAEVTRFIVKYFNPRWALNMDGGGSTTLCVKGYGTPNDVVNYPTDKGRNDHIGQRKVSTHLLVLDHGE